MPSGFFKLADRRQRVGGGDQEFRRAWHPFDDLFPDRSDLACVSCRGLPGGFGPELVDLEIAALVGHRAIANPLERVELLPGFLSASLPQQCAAERIACVL